MKGPLCNSLALATAILLLSALCALKPTPAYSASPVKPFLNMPQTASGRMPARLSQTGAFKDTRRLVPAEGLLPYDLIAPFWSDGASKQRFIAWPGQWSQPKSGQKITFYPTGEWRFPAGVVFVKTFELALDAAHPEVMHRLETRLLVRDRTGGVYGVVYKWRADQSDADLIPDSQTETLTLKAADGSARSQSWYYPSREDCLKCHTSKAGLVLGVKTRQLNRDLTYPDGSTQNELLAWSRRGILDTALDESTIAQLPRLASLDDSSASIEMRARSWLDANCSHCHRPGGTVAYFDARFDAPKDQQSLIDGQILIDEGIDRARVIAPHDPWRSIALLRISTNGNVRMPPLARETIDERGVSLMRAWIESMPGRDVVPPPSFTLPEGKYPQPVEVTLGDAEPDADIRYTIDGSTPTQSDLHYEGPIRIDGPTILRARAFKPGMTRSISVQGVYVIGKPAAPAAPGARGAPGTP